MTSETTKSDVSHERTGAVEELPSGRFRVRVRLSGVGRRTVPGTFATFEEADFERRSLMASLVGQESDEHVSLADYGDDVLEERELSGVLSDPESEASRWKMHIKCDPIGKVAVRALTDAHVRDWLKRLLKKTLARQTRVHCLNLLRTVMASAVESKKARTNPCVGIRIAKVKRTEDAWTFLTPAEQLALIAATPKPLDAIVEFAIGSGVRSGELVTLHLRDVHLDDPAPHIIVRYGKRKGGKLCPTKAGKPRRIELHGLALSGLTRWLDTLHDFCPGNPDGIVFPGPHGGYRSHDHVLLWSMWKGRPQKGVKGKRGYRAARQGILARAAITRNVRWHDLRHTCASALVSGWWGRVWTLKEVQDVLGHASITTTERYAHLGDTAQKSAARESREAGARAAARVLGEGSFVGQELAHAGPRALLAPAISSMISLERDTRFELATFGLGSQSEREENHILGTQMGQPWAKLLEAAERGDAKTAEKLAVELANEVLSFRAVRLAQQVLAGGKHRADRAIQLAELMQQAAAVAAASRPSKVAV